VLTAIALYFLVSRDRGDETAAPRMEAQKFDATVVPTVGFYDGAFGPGAGSFYTLGNAALLGRNIVSATAHAKVLNFASNLAALVIFALGGKVLWAVGAVMVAGSMLGAYAGSLVVIKKGNRVIRPAIVTMSLVMLCTYVLKSYGPA